MLFFMNSELEQLKYPIGKPKIPSNISSENITRWINVLEDFPNRIDNLTKNLSNEQLNTPYRKDGWTIRQVVHHCADSHHNSYTRFKWALTEDAPTIKAYFEDRWANLFDSKIAPISMSILHLKAVHAKLVYLLKGISEKELEKTFIHPEGNETIFLKANIGIYAWHCNHHFAHIEHLLIRKNWI